MWVKICANTNLDDALLAAELGADALGFVFAESQRQMSAEQVAAITPHLPSHIEKVGVFYTHSAEEIAEIALKAGLDTAQLHGGHDTALIERLRELLGLNFGLVQTLHWIADGSADSSFDIASQLDLVRNSGGPDRVLVDSRVGRLGGGTGVSFDWRSAREVFRNHCRNLRLIAAGGLKPDNLAQAIELMQPWGVDVASGVEATPGRKDPDRLARFLEIAKSRPVAAAAE
ncbi:MAG: phosphoribosylanthranilate isomerase [Edaphobacter sp.]|uniref:phosphoribosylanthranilate isomerase n=1 Tax=Edaphobacter sp. TaxID=1934404 RepID=UPI0023915BF4|nr:phosphoribosylanthranilate isomerase [Edaphobacter sp.]MDE1178036.1 phosphoribosylanthranilate isomerase [Edaphobacter sp.]